MSFFWQHLYVPLYMITCSSINKVSNRICQNRFDSDSSLTTREWIKPYYFSFVYVELFKTTINYIYAKFGNYNPVPRNCSIRTQSHKDVLFKGDTHKAHLRTHVSRIWIEFMLFWCVRCIPSTTVEFHEWNNLVSGSNERIWRNENKERN